MSSATRLIGHLDAWDEKRDPRSVVTGFDGFVDEMIRVVGERQGPGSWTPMSSMADLGRILTTAAGRNGLREIVVRSTDAGGCSVNLGDGLAALGVAVHHFGTTGAPRHPAFVEFAERCASCTSWGTVYGRSLCLEFDDGKFFLPAVEHLQELTPDLVRQHLVDGSYARACAEARVIVHANWTLYPHMTDIWRVLLNDVYVHLSHRPRVFFDLVDPSARTAEDIIAMLAVVSDYERAVQVCFGLNLTEAVHIAKVVGLSEPGADPQGMAEAAALLRAHLGVSEVVLHNRAGNAVASADGTCAVLPGPHCERPVKSTGAGDRFNAGYCLGLLLDLPAEERLDLGSAVAGVFLRQGFSADRNALRTFLVDWSASESAKV